MKCNVGKADRVVRGILGLILVLVGFAGLGGLKGTAATVVGVAGIILLATVVVGFCPLYRLFGVNTCGKQ